MPAAGLTRIRDIARPLGERTNKLIGQGLVVGLNGSGDSDSLGTIGPLVEMMGKLGNAIDPSEIKPKNVAYVFLSAELGRNGVREGDKIDVRVDSVFDAKSLEGGTLILSPLMGSHFEDDSLYGWAQGPVSIPNADVPTSGVITGGVDIEENILHLYAYEKYPGQTVFALVLDENHANFQTAKAVVNAINDDLDIFPGGPENAVAEYSSEPAAIALGPKNIEVTIPAKQAAYPAQFIARIMDLMVDLPEPEASVTIDRKAKVIGITGNVEITPVIVHVNGLAISVVDPPPPPLPGQPVVTQSEWAKFDTAHSSQAKLQDLLDALNQINVPFEDKANVIMTIKEQGVIRANVRVLN